ncbi:MAG: hypothetical protein AABX19_00565 [Nanoarchaeota archaeon]
MIKKNKNYKNIEIAILEYETAQNSAEHYNTMVWTLISVGLGLSIIILNKIVLEKTETIIFDEIIAKLLLSIIGILIVIYFTMLIERANKKKCLKYKICKDIEEDYKFNYKAHSITNEDTQLKGIIVLRSLIFALLIFYIIIIINLFTMGINKHSSNEVLFAIDLFLLIGSIIITLFFICQWKGYIKNND